MSRKILSSMQASPRYLVFRKRKIGFAAHYIVPKRLRPDGWPKTYTFERRVVTADDKDAAVKWAEELGAKLDAARGAGSDAPKEGAIPHLIRIIETSDNDLHKWNTLSEGSRKSYREAFKLLTKWSQSIGHPPVAQLTPQGVNALYSQLSTRPHMRKLVAAALSKLLDVAVVEGLAPRNILRDMPSPPAKAATAQRENIWPEDYFTACLEGALGRKQWSLARALAFQRYHAQRPSDAVRLHTDWLRDERLEFRQLKTGAPVRVPLDPDFKAVLDRCPAQIGPLTLNGEEPHDDKSYRNELYRLQRDLKLSRRAPKYLRHTGVLERARAGLTALQIAQETGHSPSNVTYILRHYLPQDDDLKAEASAKVAAYRKNASRTPELNGVERNGVK